MNKEQNAVNNTHKQLSDILSHHHEGVVLMYNFVYAVEHNILIKSDVRRFLQEWIKNLQGSEEPSVDMDILNHTFNKALNDTKKNHKDLTTSSQIERTSSNQDLCQILNLKDYESFYRYSLKKPAFPLGDLVPNPYSENFKEQIEDYNNIKGFKQHLSIVNFTSPRKHHLYWVCLQDDIEKKLVLQNSADRIRDLLGLIHIKSKQYICMVEIDDQFLEDHNAVNQAKRPTPIDAGFHSRYKVLSDQGIKNNHGHETGYTYDLNTEKDGVRELIVSEAKAKKLDKIRLKFIGETQTEPKNTPRDDMIFLEKLEKVGGLKRDVILTKFTELYV